MFIRARLAESNFVSMSVIAVAAIMLLGFVNVSPATAACGNGLPAVSTDKTDYAASEIAIISGFGFDCIQQLSVLITRPDGSQVSGNGTGSAGPDLITTDENGVFALNYHLSGTLPGGDPYSGQLGTYTVIVVNASGVVLATTTFDDSQNQ